VSETSSFAPPPDAPQPPVEEAGSVPAEDHVGGVSLPLRIYTSPLAHRLIPAGLAMRLLAGLGPAVRQRRNPAERADAHRFMHELLLHTERADEADELAERWLAEKSRLRELYWRPWLLRKSRVHDAGHWEAAHAGGRGCVIVFGYIVAGVDCGERRV
jgi:hypothetical protein